MIKIMKEGIEQFNKEDVVEKLQAIQKRERKIKEEDPRYGTPWDSVINIEKLIPGAKKLFELLNNNELDSAKTELKIVRNSIDQMKEGEEKNSNEGFINWIDDQILKAFRDNEVKEAQEKNNL